MFSIPYKAKQFLILLAKLLIVGGSFYFIYRQLSTNDQLDWSRFLDQFDKKKSITGVLLILLLTFLNRFIEILKWQALASYIHPISLAKSTQQVLAALTASIFTPNGIGEYGAKALFYDKKYTKTIIFLNFIGNGMQVVFASIIGIIGLIVLSFHFPDFQQNNQKSFFIVVTIILGLGLFLFFTKKITIKGYSLHKAYEKLQEIPKLIHQKTAFYALLRYLIIMHQYYLLFLFFDVEIPYFLLLFTIMGVFFLSSALPTFQFLDFAVKGGVAIYFFGLLHVNEWIVIFITTLIWFLNVVLPSLIGSYYVLSFRLKKT
ncbi:hypothetical protein [Flavobacterium sp. '19STA2R22 D10 B1']|uniref:hypothetical protein n=1 Tax=Flavobacterium aerium TaxID=3037261 RepID=UPI00278C8178|nr:hypothetical protein [Flavobacterium sp. '19STA2R22 D10 B1']